MTVLKASALTLGLAGALAFGTWTSPRIPGTPVSHAPPAPSTLAPAVGAAAPAPAAPQVGSHAKPLLASGTDLTLASEGFRSSEEFVAIVYAARHTDIPFVLLKHRVLKQGKSLATAIGEFKPELDAQLEASRAMAAARADLARLKG